MKLTDLQRAELRVRVGALKMDSTIDEMLDIVDGVLAQSEGEKYQKDIWVKENLPKLIPNDKGYRDSTREPALKFAEMPLPEKLPEFVENEPRCSIAFWNRLRINEIIDYLRAHHEN